MEKKEDFQVFPWSSNHEFRSVASIILNLDFNSNLVYNIDFLTDLQWTERQLIIWRSKTSSAQHLYEIEATHSIVNCLLHEHLPKLTKASGRSAVNGRNELDQQTNEQVMNGSTSHADSSDVVTQGSNLSTNNNQLISLETDYAFSNPSFNLINEETISVLYSNAVLKFFKMISHYDIIDGKIERLLSRSEANLVRICEQLDFPQYIIEYRHRIAHNKIPSFNQLKIAAQIALSWVKRNYWSRYLALLDGQEKSKVQIYEQTAMVLSNLFEEDEDPNCKILNKLERLNKAGKRPTKKQKVDLKRFNVLDRKQSILLNDTLYDLLTEDFYSTLHAVTLYIVDSTKEHLDSISVEQMKKWIEDDDRNMNTILNVQQTNQTGRQTIGEPSSGDQPTNAVNDKSQTKEKRKRDQLIPTSILNSFKPIFEIITKQLSSINQLLFYLHSIIEDQRMDQKQSAQLWFIQITCSLINNLNYSNLSVQDRLRIGNPLTEFEKCFKLTDVQLVDLKWIHLFTMLVEQPVMDRLNLALVRRFYPLVSFRYSKLKFKQICDLLSIYLDANDGLIGKKKKTDGDEACFDLNQLDTLPDDQLTNVVDWSKVKLGFI